MGNPNKKDVMFDIFINCFLKKKLMDRREVSVAKEGISQLYFSKYKSLNTRGVSVAVEGVSRQIRK